MEGKPPEEKRKGLIGKLKDVAEERNIKQKSQVHLFDLAWQCGQDLLLQ